MEDNSVQIIILCMLIIAFMGGGALFGIIQYKAAFDKPNEPPASILANKGFQFKVTPATDPSKNKPPMTTDLNWQKNAKMSRASNIAVNNDYVYFINKSDNSNSTDGDVYYQPVDPAKGGPRLMPRTKLTYIDAGNQMLWGFNANKQLYKCPAPCSNGDWQEIPYPRDRSRWETLSSVSTNDKLVWLTYNYVPYRCLEPCTGNWKKMGETADILSAGKSQIWTMVRPDGNITSAPSVGFCDGACDDKNWQWINGAQDINSLPILATSGIGNDITAKEPASIWMTTPNGLFRCQTPCFGNWEYVRVPTVTREKSQVVKEAIENDRRQIVDVHTTRYFDSNYDVSPTFIDANPKFAWVTTAGVPDKDPPPNAKADIGSGEVFFAKDWF